MLATERKNTILKQLFEQGHVIVKELSNELEVSNETIRRDLKELEAEGFLIKAHGGGVLSQKLSSGLNSEIRASIYLEEKELLAGKALQLISSGQSLFLDSSTTASEIAKKLNCFKNITVFTNSLLIANTISLQPQHQLVFIGGNFNTVDRSFVGPLTQRFLDNYLIDAAFLSPTGLSEEGIVTEADEEGSYIRRKILRNSQQVFLVMDQTKIYRASTYVVANINEFSGLITNGRFPEELKEIVADQDFLIEEI
jgi:DeoR/GlpR family transcriptional regulator of sugar metabolism